MVKEQSIPLHTPAKVHIQATNSINMGCINFSFQTHRLPYSQHDYV